MCSTSVPERSWNIDGYFIYDSAPLGDCGVVDDSAREWWRVDAMKGTLSIAILLIICLVVFLLTFGGC